jgi:hypothetical protein
MNDFAAILRGTLRANPSYELVLFDRLVDGERELLANLRGEPGFYGVVRPRGEPADAPAGALSVKAVDRDTALLLYTLREPGPLPAYVEELFGHQAGRGVAQLVADGVLEIAQGEVFVSGAAALRLIADGAHASAAAGGRIAEISRDALRYAEALPIDEALALSARLYGYNRRPLTPRWKRLLPDAAAVPGFLGTVPGGPAAALLSRRWTALAPSPAWLSWKTQDEAAGRLPTEGPMYKLYVSPDLEYLADGGFATIVAALTELRVPQFKVGADAAGLLRADKIVTYFPDFESLARAAHGLAVALAGAPAQGVPFTAEIGGGGLLSWGADPPRGEGLPWEGRSSWRLWIAQRLARALLAARAGRGQAGKDGKKGEDGEDWHGIPPWRFALERLRLEGVDTDTWTPGALLWKEA